MKRKRTKVGVGQRKRSTKNIHQAGDLREIFILASNNMITAFVKFLKHFVIFPVEK